jgi:hypothetical protein
LAQEATKSKMDVKGERADDESAEQNVNPLPVMVETAWRNNCPSIQAFE